MAFHLQRILCVNAHDSSLSCSRMACNFPIRFIAMAAHPFPTSLSAHYQTVINAFVKALLLRRNIIIKLYLIENKEVTLLV